MANSKTKSKSTDGPTPITKKPTTDPSTPKGPANPSINDSPTPEKARNIEEVIAAKKKKEEEDKLKMYKSPREFQKLKDEIRILKCRDYRLHKPYLCKPTYVTHGEKDDATKKEMRAEKRKAEAAEKDKLAGKAEKEKGKGSEKLAEKTEKERSKDIGKSKGAKK